MIRTKQITIVCASVALLCILCVQAFAARSASPNYATNSHEDIQQLFKLADIFEDSTLLEQAAKEAACLTKDEITLLYQKNKRLKKRIEDYLGQVTL